jgi:uncharacterized protein with ParB-like and HNH nuclease domain
MSLKNKIYVKPEKSRLINLLDDIKSGRIKIPVFQRDYVWKKPQRLELFDSLNSGFPIGSLLFWKPQDLTFEFNKSIGPFQIDYLNANFSYVLDGFQRISTLFGALINPNTYKDNIDNNILSDYLLHYDLKEEEFVQIRGKEEIYHIALYKLIDTFEFLSFSENLRNKILDEDLSSLYINRAKKLANQLLDYEIPFVEIIGGDIEDAVEIFHRINSKGSDISPIWMLNALTYVQKGFRFNDKIIDLKEKLEKYNFQDLPSDIILHCIETSTGKIYFDVKLKTLSKSKDFPSLVEETFLNIQTAVDFLYYRVNVFESKVLPYNLQLIFITEFFRLNKTPSDLQLLELEKWFWTTSYANYFSIYSLSKQRIAFQQFQQFARGEISNSIYNDDKKQKFKTLAFPYKILYGSVRSKCLALFLVKNYLENNYSDAYIFNDFRNKDFEFKYLINKGKRAEMAIPVDKNVQFSNIKRNNDFTFLLSEHDADNIYYQSYFIDKNLIELYKNNLIPEMMDYRKNLIIDAESKFVESLGIEYHGSDNFDFEKHLRNESIKNNIEKLDWDFNDKVVILDDDQGPQYTQYLNSLDKLIEAINDRVVQDVIGEMPSYILQEIDYMDYSDLVSEYLQKNRFAEINRMGWEIIDYPLF